MEFTMLPGRSVDEFAQHVQNAPTNPASERLVRVMMQKVAANCPMEVLVQLAACVIECRRSELRGEAERN
jgi:hypothetical protein